MSESEHDLEALFEELSTHVIANPVESQPAAIVQQIAPAAIPALARQEPTDTKPIFDRLGSVVRVLHDSMRELGYDRSLSEVTSQITDAHERLSYIATLTEQAANKVLNATDEGIPAQDELAKKAKDMDERWTALFAGKMSIDTFKELARDSHSFTKEIIVSTELEKARLLNIMMSQDFQDLTGQLIKKVTAITSAVEKELAQILIDNAPTNIKVASSELAQGPSLPASALGQGDVDNLLDSLGF